MRVRAASHDDLTDLAAFGRQVLDDTYIRTEWLEAGEVADMLDWWTPDYFLDTLGGPHILRVADQDGAIVGMTQTEIIESGRAVMWKLYVDGAHRGRGVGTALVEATRTALPATVTTWQTEYLSTNEPAAAFYRARGFEFDHDEDYAGRTYRWVAQSPSR